jgi:hypothetical protein
LNPSAAAYLAEEAFEKAVVGALRMLGGLGGVTRREAADWPKSATCRPVGGLV